MNDVPTMTMVQRSAEVLEHIPIAERTFRIRLACPDLAAHIRPGQFVMLRLPGRTDPLLARPFALYETAEDSSWLDIVYLVLGKMTGLLAQVQPGEKLEIWGPLGKPFLEVPSSEEITFVAGGIGQTPFLSYAKELLGKRSYGGVPARRSVENVRLLYGVRTAALAAGVEDFRSAGVEVQLASDDGSIGFCGFVTQLLKQNPGTGPIIGCGPEPMLHALSDIAKEWNRLCHVSLETPMACGVGICFSCVAKVCTSDGFDYKRVCVDGPVFDAAQLVWE